MTDSIVLWSGAALLFAGIAGVVYPLRVLGIRTRRSGATVAGAGLLLAAAAVAWPAPEAVSVAPARSHLDQIMPRWQFSERHTIRVAASQQQAYEAVRSVRADEIALFGTLTWIRRLGRRGPESILNAPERIPLLDVATRTTFRLLADEPPREIVIGTVVIGAPTARHDGTLESVVVAHRPRHGVAVATMNFLVTPDGRGGSNVSTETRVFASDGESLRSFTTYWRIIHPGSDIIRRMWLRAIRRRAEAPQHSATSSGAE